MFVERQGKALGQMRAASTPGGGLARQWRVQYWSGCQLGWAMYGSYPTPQQAEQCLRQLQQQGLQARMVCYGICPAAA